MTQYADISDLKAKYRLTPEQEIYAEQYLTDASIMLRDLLSAEGKSVEMYEEDTITKIVRDVAYRALSAINSGANVSQYTQSAIGYAETFSFSNPQGDLYLTKLEKSELGLGGAKIYSICPYVNIGGGRFDKR